MRVAARRQYLLRDCGGWRRSRRTSGAQPRRRRATVVEGAQDGGCSSAQLGKLSSRADVTHVRTRTRKGTDAAGATHRTILTAFFRSRGHSAPRWGVAWRWEGTARVCAAESIGAQEAPAAAPGWSTQCVTERARVRECVCVRACVFDFLACVKMRGSRDRAKWGDRDQWDRACVRGRARAEVSASPMHEIAES